MRREVVERRRVAVDVALHRRLLGVAIARVAVSVEKIVKDGRGRRFLLGDRGQRVSLFDFIVVEDVDGIAF